MTRNKLRIAICKENWRDGYELLLIENGHDHQSIGEPVVMREMNPGECITNPTAQVSRDAMQDLFNELWTLGFRPADGTGNSGHIQAISYHLEDMRRLVFKEKDKK